MTDWLNVAYTKKNKYIFINFLYIFMQLVAERINTRVPESTYTTFSSIHFTFSWGWISAYTEEYTIFPVWTLWAPCQRDSHTAEGASFGSAQHLFSFLGDCQSLTLIVFHFISFSNIAQAMFILAVFVMTFK